MTNFLKKYLWIFEWVGAAILIGLGITVVFAKSIIYVVPGIMLVIFGLFRIIPLIKTTKTKSMMITLIVEISLNVIIGGLLIYFGLKLNQDSSAIQLESAYGYLLGAILYVRGFIYFMGTSLFKERTSPFIFGLHIIFITLGTWSIVIKGFTPETLRYIILGLAILAGLLFILHGARGYKNYRFDSLAIDETQNIKVKDQPAKSKNKDVILDKQEEKREENILN